ncbi:MAG TPA: hypothetical protein VFN25_07215 [Dokdonella sp.]|uniref:hypothetical protein n=1 Tax=Dokdonella sp. TaxID=2291710 RepID=UPI002D7F078C|nr:hypothetical protein [Dokdonella sp.]HET9032679.1 hypothetical protein [Dokdonella sp.]
MRATDKRYLRELLPSMAVYTIVMLTVWPLVRTTDDVMLRALIAMAPVIPIGFTTRAIIRHILAADEMMQRLHLEALAISAGVVGVTSLIGGFLAAGEVISLDGSILFWVFPVLAGTFGLARSLAIRRCDAE